MPTRKILVTGPRLLRDMETSPDLQRQMDELATQLDAEFLLRPPVQQWYEHELMDMVGDIDATLCGGDHWTARVMDAAPKLLAICKWGTGINAIDLVAAAERGILVRNVPDAFSAPVSDTVMSFMLNFARKTPWLDREIKSTSLGGKNGWNPIEGVSLGECTLGVIGVGNIGRTLLGKARAFGMTLLGHDPVQPPERVLDETGVSMVSMDELLAESDFVSINCDLNPTSYHLINAAALDKMKPSAVLINTARGPIVEQAALTRALLEKKLAGAGLDVFETEPLEQDDPLRSMDNVLLSPHLSQSSPRACWRTHDRAMENLREAVLAASAQRARV
jgi:D-3-phosphoglycerate dehydrogenase / 2-oxoglutarate reductase